MSETEMVIPEEIFTEESQHSPNGPRPKKLKYWLMIPIRIPVLLILCLVFCIGVGIVHGMIGLYHAIKFIKNNDKQDVQKIIKLLRYGAWNHRKR